MKLAADTKLLALAAVAGLGLVWWVTRPGTAGKLAGGAVAAVGDAAVGTVKGVATWFGIPDTNQSQCDKDLAAGRYWDASFSCPAGRFIGAGYDAATGVFNSTTLSAAEALDARRDFALTDPRRVDLAQPDPLVSDSGMDYRYF